MSRSCRSHGERRKAPKWLIISRLLSRVIIIAVFVLTHTHKYHIIWSRTQIRALSHKSIHPPFLSSGFAVLTHKKKGQLNGHSWEKERWEKNIFLSFVLFVIAQQGGSKKFWQHLVMMMMPYWSQGEKNVHKMHLFYRESSSFSSRSVTNQFIDDRWWWCIHWLANSVEAWQLAPKTNREVTSQWKKMKKNHCGLFLLNCWR